MGPLLVTLGAVACFRPPNRTSGQNRAQTLTPTNGLIGAVAGHRPGGLGFPLVLTHART